MQPVGHCPKEIAQDDADQLGNRAPLSYRVETEMKVVTKIKFRVVVKGARHTRSQKGRENPQVKWIAEALDEISADRRDEAAFLVLANGRILPLLDLPDGNEIDHQAENRNANAERLQVMI